jgi:hypothetical protein
VNFGIVAIPDGNEAEHIASPGATITLLAPGSAMQEQRVALPQMQPLARQPDTLLVLAAMTRLR